MERPALSDILKCIPSPKLSRFSNDINMLKTKDPITSLQPATQYITSNQTPVVSNQISLPKADNDLLHFIEKQEGYIEQLERESKFCRVSFFILFFYLYITIPITSTDIFFNIGRIK